MNPSIPLILLLPVLGACAAAPTPAPAASDELPAAAPLGETAPPAGTIAVDPVGPGAVEAAGPTVAAPATQDPAATGRQDPPRAARGRLTWTELRLWNEPGFRRRFAESYLSETEIEPGVSLDEREVMLEVLDLISADKLGDAAELIEDSRTDASSAVFDFTLANIHFQRDEFDQAIGACRLAIDKHPKFRRAWRMIGQIHVRRAEFSEAVPALTRVVELGGTDALSYGMLGFAYLSLGDHVPAESAFRQALLVDPYTMDWKMGLAESLFRQGRYADASSFFGKLIEDNPSRPELWLAQGEAFARLGDTLGAAENFEMVDRLGGSSFDSLVNLGDIYANEELFEMAVDAYSRAIDRDPAAKIDRVLRAAKYLSANGALAETRQLVEKIEAVRADALDLETRKDLLRVRARIAVAEGVGEEEVKILEEIVTLDPLDGDALILLGQHSGRAGDPEQAVFYFERAANIEGFEADAKIRHAQLLVGQGKYQEALPLLRRAQAIQPRETVQEYLEQVERFAQSR
jgi:tetratricopeptide (TPR) repeat protein